jgi:aspartate/methionine/tyrosine aminotransferase
MKFPSFKLEKFFEKWEFNTPYLLCASDNESLSLKELLALADEESLCLWNNLQLGYTYVPGLPIIRKEIAQLYRGIDENGIGTFAGAEEAIYSVMSVLLQKGDHVIVPIPCYQSLLTLPQTLGCTISPLSIREGKDGWYFDIADLAALLTPQTKLIVINFPHNPTSAHIDQATLEKIVGHASSVGAYLLSDEVYRFSEHQAKQSLPPAANLYEKAISVGVMSKTFGLAGLRVGWLATQDADLLKRCLDFKCYLSLCNSAPSEILALMALRAKKQIIERNLSIIHSNLEKLDLFFNQHKEIFDWKKPRAGSTAFPKLLLNTPIDAFAEDLIAKEGVLLLPGSIYDFPGNYFRLGFGRKDLPEALARLERYLHNYYKV